MPESKQLVVELMLPSLSVIPQVVLYKYISSTDNGRNQFPMTQRRQLYSSVVAQMSLRTVHEIFSSDSAGHIDALF